MTESGQLKKGVFVEPEIRQAARNHGMLLEAFEDAREGARDSPRHVRSRMA